VPYAGKPGPDVTGPYNLSASYAKACATTLGAFSCPAGDAVNPGTSTPAASFVCICGTFDASTRVAEDLLDHVMAPVMAAIAAEAAAARAAATPACPAANAHVPLAYAVAIVVLGGMLVLLAAGTVKFAFE
jgi:hypothetical protein